jgi:hypothetical protein
VYETGKIEVVPVRGTEACGGSGGVTQRTLNLGNRGAEE